LPGGLKKTTKNELPFRIVGVPAEIGIKYLPNIGLRHYRYTHPFGICG
jgi:hypothetical protein